MEVYEAIHTRRSIRKYTRQQVSPEIVDKVLRAAMAAPSAANRQQWCFLVINDRAILDETAKVVPPFTMLKEATLGILVCGDLTKVNPGSTIFVQSCSAAVQNILLAAHASGLGAVWLGVHPLPDRVDALKKQFSLPDTVAPFAFVSIGHPAEQKPPEDRYQAAAVHLNKW